VINISKVPSRLDFGLLGSSLVNVGPKHFCSSIRLDKTKIIINYVGALVTAAG